MQMVGILVDANGWHIGRCTCMAHWWMHMVGILVDAQVGMLIEAYD
jgi:hypothetical protein